MEAEEDTRTFREKFLFYTTAFFVLLAIFSLFIFLFLVPFFIEPAFTTIFMQFDENPAFCVTMQTEHYFSTTNCSWASCREGCTREVSKILFMFCCCCWNVYVVGGNKNPIQ